MTTTARAEADAAVSEARDAGERMLRLVSERGHLASILGSDPTTVERFKTVMLSALTSSPKLLRADPASLVQAIRESAMWDLEPDGVDAVIVPYWDSKRSVYVADFQPTARGYVRVLYRSPKVKFVDADVVYANDYFEYEKGAVPRLVHRPLVFGERGERLGAYALVQLDSGFMRPIVLNVDQIEARRKVARDSEKGPWLDWIDEMWRKTALRSIMSIIPVARGVKAALAAESAKWEALPAPAEMPTLPPATPMLAIEAARAAFFPDQPAQDAPQPEEGTFREVDATPEPVAAPEQVATVVACGEVATDGLMAGAVCILKPDHTGAHKSGDGSWPQ